MRSALITLVLFHLIFKLFTQTTTWLVEPFSCNVCLFATTKDHNNKYNNIEDNSDKGNHNKVSRDKEDHNKGNQISFFVKKNLAYWRN